MLIQIRNIKAVSYAMSDKKETRSYLHGMLLETDGKSARLVATDGVRLHAVRFSVDANDSADSDYVVKPGRYILPREFVDRAMKGRGHLKNGVLISIDNGILTAKFLDADPVNYQLLDGVFPKYNILFPSAVVPGGRAIYNPQYLNEAQLAARDFSDEEHRLFPITTYITPYDDIGLGILNLGDFIALVMPIKNPRINDTPDIDWRTRLVVA